jgi:cytidylate kinase
MRHLTSPTLERMVSRQVRRWVLQEERLKAPDIPRCVALSRQPGSGAAELGKLVAEDLQFGFFGAELVDQIARTSHVHPRLVANLDERLRGAIERFVRDGIRVREYDESHYHEALMRVLGTFAERGMAVLLGRGAPYVLPEERTLRVLVVASEPYRLARLQAATGLDPESARDRLIREDQQRQRFIEHYFGVCPDDPILYDLVVNTETLGTPNAARLVTHAYRKKFDEPRSGSRSIEIELPSGTAATL